MHLFLLIQNNFVLFTFLHHNYIIRVIKPSLAKTKKITSDICCYVNGGCKYLYTSVLMIPLSRINRFCSFECTSLIHKPLQGKDTGMVEATNHIM